MKANNYSIHPSVYFIVAALLIAYFFPREGKFRYQFYEGKPWRYGLLTAPSDFPIYKTDAEVQAERDSALKKFEPYYRLDTTIESEEIDKLRANYQGTLKNRATPAYMQYIENSLQKLYRDGIISTQDMDELKKEEYPRINLLAGSVAHPHYSSDFFTVKTAYEFIINNCPSYLDKSVLQSCDINNYLVENITYDKTMSEKVREDILNSIPLANGMIQAGERIVDRGEIIDNHTYNVLRSLKIVHETKSGGAQRQGIIMGGQFVLVFGILFCFWLYLWSFRLKILHNRRNALFLVLCVFVSCILTELCVTYGLFNVYILPFAIVPIVVRTFFDSRTALFTHLIIVLICSLMVPFPHEFLLLQVIAVLCALLHQPVHLPGSGLQEDQLDDDALFRHQFYPADVYLHISLYAGKDIRLCVQHYVGRTLQHQYADPKKAVRNISGNLPTFFADVDLSVGSGCRYRSKRAARTYRSHVS